MYFTFKIGFINGAGNLFSYKQPDKDTSDKLINYYSFYIQNNFKVVLNNDTLPCILSHFEKYGVLFPFISFVLAFECNTYDINSGDLKFIYDDKILGLNEIILIIKKKNIVNIPALETGTK